MIKVEYLNSNKDIEKCNIGEEILINLEYNDNVSEIVRAYNE